MIAILPLFLMDSNSFILVRFTKPCFVTNTKFFSSLTSFGSIEIIDVIFSSFSIGIKLIIGNPFDCLLPSGISYPLTL